MGKSCLTTLTALYDGIAGRVNQGRAEDIIYLNSSKAFDTVSCNIPIGKLRKPLLNEQTVRWIKNG